jgi:hypothetical protein
LDLRTLEQIASDGEHLPAVCGQIVFRALKFILIAREDRNATAFVTNLARQH